MSSNPVPRKRWLAALAAVLIVPGVARTQDASEAATPNSLRDACVKALGSVEPLEHVLLSTRAIPEEGLTAARADARAAFEQWASMTWSGEVRLVKRTMRTKINRAINMLDRCATVPPPSFKYLKKYLFAADAALEQGIDAITPYTTATAEPAPEPDPVVDAPTPAPADPVAAPSTIPILRPGTGFSGSTAQPSRVGSGWASTATAIARWDVVPFQTFDTELQIGVVAFHANGIDRVEFSADGGTWTASTAPTLNPATGVWEYCVLLRAQDYSDGQVEIRAVVYPNAGVPRVLAGNLSTSLADADGSMVLSANYGHSLNESTVYADAVNGSDSTGDGTSAKPFKTLSNAMSTLQSRRNFNGGCDGATVNLKAGSYTTGTPSPSTDSRWLTIQAAPGVARSSVKIDSYSSGVNTNLLHVKNVTMLRPGNVYVRGGAAWGGYLWLDSVVLDGNGRTNNWATTYADREFITDTTYKNCPDGPRGVHLVRGCTVQSIREDAFSNSMMVLRSTVDDISAAGTDAHPDIYQFYGASGSRENVILYDIRATRAVAQHIFAKDFSSLNNVAIVNVLAAEQYNTDGGFASQWGDNIGSCDHLVFHNVTLASQTMLWYDEATYSNVSIRGSCFLQFGEMGSVGWSTSKIQDNHFVNTTNYGAVTRGTGISTGNAGFASPSTDDYAPSSTSVLKDRMSPLAPDDVTGAARATSDSVGAYK